MAQTVGCSALAELMDMNGIPMLGQAGVAECAQLFKEKESAVKLGPCRPGNAPRSSWSISAKDQQTNS